MQGPALLDNISIVLVDSKTPANIGAVARCMMNMGLTHLLLVNPPRDNKGEASKLAAGADSVLQKAREFPRLKDAVADHGLVIGTTRHTGRLRKNLSSPREIASKIIPLLANNRVAIVFGNEVNGLTNEELGLCHESAIIPSADTFPSLNLSHAVMVMAYELFLASTIQVQESQSCLARTEELEDFYTHLQDTLLGVGFINDKTQDRMLFSLRQVFGRSRMEERDIKIMRGILSAIQRIKQEKP